MRKFTLFLMFLAVAGHAEGAVETTTVQGKVLTPNDFSTIDEVADRLARFEKHYEKVATPFQWKFTRKDLDKLLEKLQDHDNALRPAA